MCRSPASSASSNLCRDEKRTERSWTLEQLQEALDVATYAAMKSGLKAYIRRIIIVSIAVATYAAMKSGLKETYP